jgi:long-chain acyl-CoA synthetase
MTHALTFGDIQAVIADMAGAVLGLAPAEIISINAATRLDAEGLGLDSLARLDLATSVSTFFRLHESELEDDLLRRRTVGDWTASVMHGWAHGSHRITFATSGSTGVPVLCTHTWSSIVQELDAQARLFAGRQRVLGLVGPRHIYGFFFCALLPRWLGVPFVDIRASSPKGLVGIARIGDLVVGFPLLWDLAVPSGSWVQDVVGATSTGPINPATVMALGEQGLARMVEIYGSSETGGIAWRDQPTDVLHPYPHWSLRSDGRLERADAEIPGKMQVIEPPDILAARNDGFDVVRRRDGKVQVAGTNVSCAHVAAVLSEHPDISACAVRPMQAHEGARLKAFIVLAGRANADAVRTELRMWMRSRLTTAETPMDIVFGSALPRDGLGKLADWPSRRQQREQV